MADDGRTAADLAEVVSDRVDVGEYPHAADVVSEVLVYDAQKWSGCEGSERVALRSELARVLSDGPGVFVLRGAFADTAVIDAATAIFEEIIAGERAAGGAAGDHFGAAGANARVWNAQQKLALQAPEVFAEYFANDAIAVASEAWLGPGYQVTSQVNLVYPGGKAQEPHRDYHLGFMSDEQAGEYPMHVHAMSGLLTLQGAVAHCDMPVDSGTTMLLPHSQKFPKGYVAYRRPDVKEYFAENMVQLPLAKGDVIFFNPALIHGAGTNRTTNIHRMANLLQVSSAFGRSLEALDRLAMCASVYPVLVDVVDRWPARAVDNVIAACAEGYPFPTSLDNDQPLDGMAPDSQAVMVRRALAQRRPVGEVMADLTAAVERQQP